LNLKACSVMSSQAQYREFNWKRARRRKLKATRLNSHEGKIVEALKG
jgi:hypothetical protein